MILDASEKRKDITQKIREKGMTVSGWARLNNFNPYTVFRIIYGQYTGKGGPKAQEILNRLKEDGLLKENGNECN